MMSTIDTNATRKPFLVTVNLTKVLSNDDDMPKFTMLVDDTKMTIVYEFVEWIRWVFAIKDCFYLAHENSAIHDLEDIKILSSLKILEVNLCVSAECVHKKFYKTLLNGIELYTPFKKTRVPKFFVEKVEEINQKLCYNLNNTPFSQDDTPLAQKNNSLNKKVVQNLVGSSTLKSNQFHQSEVDIEEKEMNLQKIRNNVDSLQYNVVPSFCGNRKLSDNPLCSSTTNLLGNMDTSGQAETINVSDSANFSEECLHKNVNNEMPLNTIKSSTNFGKKKNIAKPFSLAAIVAGLRSESEKQECAKSTPIKTSSNELDHAENKLTDESTVLGPLDIMKKKRKRLRKHKSKKKMLESEKEFFPCYLNQLSNFTLSNASEKKSSHIRFSSFSEDEEIDGELNETNSPNIENKTTESTNVQSTNDSKEMTNSKTKKLVLNINDKKNTSDLDTIGPKDLQNLMDWVETPKSENEPEQNLINFSVKDVKNGICNNESCTNINITNENDFTLNEEFTALKNKFPQPAVFKRFY